MSTCKHDFIVHVYYVKPKIKCAEITTKYSVARLKEGHSDEDVAEFLKQLDFTYWSGVIETGTIWFEDGSWSYRKRHGDSEWWEYVSMPVIPNHLLKDN